MDSKDPREKDYHIQLDIRDCGRLRVTTNSGSEKGDDSVVEARERGDQGLGTLTS